jgi:hypothetical protein
VTPQHLKILIEDKERFCCNLTLQAQEVWQAYDTGELKPPHVYNKYADIALQLGCAHYELFKLKKQLAAVINKEI